MSLLKSGAAAACHDALHQPECSIMVRHHAAVTYQSSLAGGLGMKKAYILMKFATDEV